MIWLKILELVANGTTNTILLIAPSPFHLNCRNILNANNVVSQVYEVQESDDESDDEDDACTGLNHWTEPPSWSTRLQVWPKYLTLFQLRLAIYLFSFPAALTLLTYLVKIYHFPQRG